MFTPPSATAAMWECEARAAPGVAARNQDDTVKERPPARASNLVPLHRASREQYRAIKPLAFSLTGGHIVADHAVGRTGRQHRIPIEQGV